MSKQFNYLKYLRMVYIVEEHAYKYVKLGVAILFVSLSLINSSDVMQECELMSLSHGHWIRDEELRFYYIAT